MFIFIYVLTGDGDSATHCVNYHPFIDSLPWSPCLRRVFNSSVALPDAVALEKIKRLTDFRSLSRKLTSASFLFRFVVITGVVCLGGTTPFG